MIEELKSIIVDYQEINRLLNSILSVRKITFDQQVEISNYFDKYSDSNQISIVLLNNINETKFLKVLYAEVDQFVKSYNENKIFLDGLNIKELYYEYSGIYDNLIEQKLISIKPIANKFQETNKSLEATAYGSHKLEEIEKRKIEYYQAKEIYYDEKKELDELYDEKKEREKYSLKFLKNRFNDTFILSVKILDILKKYLPLGILKVNEYLDVKVLSQVFEFCKDEYFEETTSINFYLFFNLSNDSKDLIIRKGKKIYICHLIKRISLLIDTDNRTIWREAILNKLDFLDFYKKKSNELEYNKTSNNNKKAARFIDELDEILQK